MPVMTAVLHDVALLAAIMPTDHATAVSALIPALPQGSTLVHSALRKAVAADSSLGMLRAPCVAGLATRVGQRCIEDARVGEALRGVKSSCRMSQRTGPTAASPYATVLLEPLRRYLAGEGAGLRRGKDGDGQGGGGGSGAAAGAVAGEEVWDTDAEVAGRTVAIVAGEYGARVGQLLRDVRKEEDSLKRLRRGKAAVGGDQGGGAMKLYTQMKLDVQVRLWGWEGGGGERGVVDEEVVGGWGEREGML